MAFICSLMLKFIGFLKTKCLILNIYPRQMLGYSHTHKLMFSEAMLITVHWIKPQILRKYGRSIQQHTAE
jgi:hypothetical protein